MRHSMAMALVAGLVCLLRPAPVAAGGLLDFVDKLNVSGHGQLLLQQQNVSGTGSSAYYGQYWNTGALEGSASVHVEGPLFMRGLSLRADVTRTGNFGINDTRWALTQQVGDGALTYGDINVNLRGGEFASFYKQIHGTQFDYEVDKGTFVTGFFATEKGAVYRETIQGENTAGPYFLKAAPIIDGSEVVKVDEQVMRFGVDYVLQYETGQLYFETAQRPPRIIPSTSNISVSYQSLRGATGSRLLGFRAVRALGKAKGSAGGAEAGQHRETLAGNDTPGPYSLKAPPIAEGSEQVKLDEQPLRFGVDYVLDYETGKLYFRTDQEPGRIIPSTSVISVTYRKREQALRETTDRAFGSGMRGGALSRTLSFGEPTRGKGHIGFSFIEQDAGTGRTSRDTATFRRDVYYGSGTTGPFQTTYRPILADGTVAVINGQQQVIPDALIVTVDSGENIQREGLDYQADYTAGIIEFYRIVPPTSTVYIKYYYEPRTQNAPLQSSRRVFGMDMSYPLSKTIGLESELALGGALDGPEGVALRTGVHGTFKKLDLSAEYRQVAPEFTYVNSVGFQRNEKGLNFRAGYEPRKYVRTDFQFSDLRTALGYSFGSSPYGYGGIGSGVGNYSSPNSASPRAQADNSTIAQLDTHSQRSSLGLDFTFPGWPQLRIMRDSMSNSGGSGGDNDYGNLSFDLSYAPKGKSYQLSANHSLGTQHYTSTSTTSDGGTSIARLGTETASTRLGATWRPMKDLDFSGSFSTNVTDDRSASGRSTDSQMMQANARWRASEKFNVGVSHLITKSTGALFGSFFPGGNFGGYGGGGPRSVDPGAPWAAGRQTDGDGTEETTTSQYVDRGTRLDLDYRPSNRLSFTGGIGIRRYQSGGTIGYRADSDQRDLHLTANYMLSPSLTLSGSFTHNDVTFLEEGRGSINNDDMLLNLTRGSQTKGLDWNVQLHHMRGSSPAFSSLGGSTTTATESVDTGATDVSAQIGYSISDRSRVHLNVLNSDLSGGFGDTKRFDAALGYEFRISPTLSLDFSYRLVSSDGNASYGGTSGSGGLAQSYSASVLSLTLKADFAGGPRVRATGPGYQSSFNSGQGNAYDSELNSTFGSYRTGRPSTYGSGYGGTQSSGSYGSGTSGWGTGGFGSYSSPGASYSSPFGSFGSY